MIVSIIIPVYNGERFLAETISSVQEQTFADWKLIVVDDGSADSSLSIASTIAESDRRITVVSKENSGVASARNFGVAQIDPSSEFVAFLDQDDRWDANFLLQQVQLLHARTDSSACHCLARLVDENGLPLQSTPLHIHRRKMMGTKIVDCTTEEDETYSALICDNWIPTPGAVLIRREALDHLYQLNGIYFDRGMKTADDWDLWIRLSLIAPIAVINLPLMDWRIHGENNSGNISTAYNSEFSVRYKMARLSSLAPEQRKEAVYRFRKACCSANLVAAIHHLRAVNGQRPLEILKSLFTSVRHMTAYLLLRPTLASSNALPTVPDPVTSHRSWPPIQ